MSSVANIERFCEGAFYIPTRLVKSGPKSVLGYSDMFRPLRHRPRGSVELYKNVASSVVALLFGRCPPAILRGVIPAGVNALNRHVIARHWPKISIEILKRIKPSVADTNPSAAVVRERNVVCVQASLLHGAPRLPFGGVCHSVLECFRDHSNFTLNTSTRFAPSTNELRANNGDFVSAFANAVPLNFPGIGSLRCLLQYRESIEAFARQIKFLPQNILRMNIARVCGAWQSNTEFDFRPLNLATQRNFILTVKEQL